MAFFNPKEDVIDIQLTEHGKIMLANGKFRPVYYEFFDDDILYDTEYGGIQENQKDINTRIKSQVRERTQYSFVMSSSGSASPLDQYRNNFYPLGNSSLIKQRYPAFSISTFNNKISSSYDTVKGENTGSWANERILELEDIEYTIYIDYTDITSQNNIGASNIFADGTILKVKDNELFLDIAELNTDILKENFEISLILEEDGEEKKLFFENTQEEQVIKNNLLVDNPDFYDYLRKKENDLFNSKEFISYYFDINIDKQVPQSVLCQHLSSQEISKLKIIEGYDISCERPEVRQTLTTSSFTIPSEEDR